jgi:hypothetical protein
MSVWKTELSIIEPYLFLLETTYCLIFRLDGVSIRIDSFLDVKQLPK